MITLDVDGSHVLATFEGRYPIKGRSFTLSWNAGTSWAARLLWWHLDDRLRDTLRDIRWDAYEQGWRDAKAKSRKQEQEYMPCGWGWRFRD